MMECREFPKGNLKVSALGFGAGQIGESIVSEGQVEELLQGAVELGITLFDSARSYGLSEERLGRHLRSQRDHIVLSTKVGYGVPGVEDWTGECIRLGIDAALQRMATDRLDIVHLHSCPRQTLESEEVIGELMRAKEAGKILCAAYSGDNEDLDFAISLDVFDSIQTSLSFCDQRSIDKVAPEAVSRGLGLIAKRPLGNAPWRYSAYPEGEECAEYWQRYDAMSIEANRVPWHELAIRFAAFSPGVSSIITGTKSLVHLRESAEAIAKGPLDPTLYEHIRASFHRAGPWPGKI